MSHPWFWFGAEQAQSCQHDTTGPAGRQGQHHGRRATPCHSGSRWRRCASWSAFLAPASLGSPVARRYVPVLRIVPRFAAPRKRDNFITGYAASAYGDLRVAAHDPVAGSSPAPGFETARNTRTPGQRNRPVRRPTVADDPLPQPRGQPHLARRPIHRSLGLALRPDQRMAAVALVEQERKRF